MYPNGCPNGFPKLVFFSLVPLWVPLGTKLGPKGAEMMPQEPKIQVLGLTMAPQMCSKIDSNLAAARWWGWGPAIGYSVGPCSPVHFKVQA